MKKIFILSLFIISTFIAQAQKSAVSEAFEMYNIHQFDRAKEDIDKAAQNAKTKDDPKTWAYRSLIYSAMVLDTTKKANLDANTTEAEKSIGMAQKLDTKGEYKQEIKNSNLNIAQHYSNVGVKAYGAQDYKTAAEAFKKVTAILPTDTTFVLNTIAAESRAKDTLGMIKSYQTLNHLGKKAEYYMFIANLQKAKKDSMGYKNTLDSGLMAFPKDNGLVVEDLNYTLLHEKGSGKIVKIRKAINLDPTNTSLYVVLGSTFEQLKQPDSAINVYKKALSVDPKSFEANFNLGAIYYNEAANTITLANKIPTNKTKEYNAAVAKYKMQFQVATPYLEAALKASPKDIETMRSLKEIYTRGNELDKAKEMKERMDKLK